ncbi:MAG: dienelactone hydrolase family protein [Chloroflexi bacterium]|nr:dienelactone hydrolase family protein [Chloroflexota bacterium]
MSSNKPSIPPSDTTGGDNSLRNYLVEEFVEDFQEGRISRREALVKLSAIFGSIVVATNFLAACVAAPTPTPTAKPAAAPTPPPATKPPAAAAPPATPAPAPKAAPTPPSAPTVVATATVVATQATVPTATARPITIRPDDPDIEARMAEFDSKGAKVMAYLAKPKGNGPFPIVLICHENRGLVEHIKDVARRAAKVGYAALAIDLLSREGGTDKVGADVPGVLGNTPPQRFVDDFKDGLVYVQSQPFVAKDRVGMFGFCFGGGVTWRSATQIPELRAAIPFYGPNPPLGDVPGIRAAVLAIYGGNDARINAGIPEIEAAMKQNNKVFEKLIYDGAGHAFHNDTGAAYNANAAKDAWAKTLAWLDRYVRS